MTALLRTIYTYRAQWNAYRAATLDDEETAVDSSQPALTALEGWNARATDASEACEAARLALEFYEAGDSDVIPAMLRAIIGYFETPSLLAASSAASPVMVLFAEWNRLRTISHQLTDEGDVAEATERTDAVMRQLVATPPTDARDMAAKLCSVTYLGDFPDLSGDSLGAGVDLIKECAEMVGFGDQER